MERVTLSASELFAFNSDALAQSQPKLDELAQALSSNKQIGGVTVNGYTDRLGTDRYNVKLSQRRANAVKAYLVSKGVDAGSVNAVGKGKANSVVECKQKNRAALIKCLEPNRRIEVEQISYERQVK
jgi:OmpA-OmpF porin, OOP family